MAPEHDAARPRLSRVEPEPRRAEHDPNAEKCTCLICASDRDFDLPPQLADACREGDLVVFAGAGISTESPVVVEQNFYVLVLLEVLEWDEELTASGPPTFPQLMTAYEGRKGRHALLRRIKKHLDYVRSFPTIDAQAGAFHTELSTIYTITDIVTTNWDDYFERDARAQPFVTEADWPYRKTSRRRVFKIHGSVSNPGSIVATEDDYERCYRELNEGLVGASLKELLATKTVVFVGYSLRDSDFVALYDLMKKRMGDLLPRAYVVTLDENEPPDVARDMHIIHTGGVRFLQELKAILPESCFVPDERFDHIPLMRELLSRIHTEHLVNKGEMSEDPAMLVCACYQDGLLDALDYIEANKGSGEFSHRCEVVDLLKHYEGLREERERAGIWHTVAYIEGYINGLTFLIADDETRKKMPIFFVFGSEDDLRDPDAYEAAAKRFAEAAPDAYAQAKALADRLAPGVVFQHRPSL